jgi:hypothetical protein
VRHPSFLAPHTYLATVTAHCPEVPIRAHRDGEDVHVLIMKQQDIQLVHCMETDA